jgi:hypothetical protein
VDFLPRCAISKKLRYEKQIKAPHLFRLLSLEMLHRRVEIEKQDYRKKCGKAPLRRVTYLTILTICRVGEYRFP